MTQQFEVNILSVKQVHTLPGIWPPETLRALLTLVELEDLNEVEDKDLLDMTVMALQDLGNQQAGERVLEIIFGETMRPGVRQNLVDDLQQDEPWEDFAVVAQQRGLFVAVVLLQQAFPNRYAIPDALALQLTIQGPIKGDEIRKLAGESAWLLRLLAKGMPDTAPLNRLYESEIESGPFEEAGGLVWHCEIASSTAQESGHGVQVTVDLVGSYMWFESLTKGLNFQTRIDI